MRPKSILARLEIPPLWMLLCALAAGGAAAVAPVLRFAAPGALAALPAAAGFGLILWAAAEFRRRRTTVHPRRRPTALAAAGPYRINRNPMYTGMALILLGWALHLGALSALVAPPLFALIIDRRFVREEERLLRGAFGPEAERFLARTRRW